MESLEFAQEFCVQDNLSSQLEYPNISGTQESKYFAQNAKTFIFLRKNAVMSTGLTLVVPSPIYYYRLILNLYPLKKRCCMYQEYMDSRFTRKEGQNTRNKMRIQFTILTTVKRRNHNDTNLMAF